MPDPTLPSPTIRRAGPADLDDAIALAATALGWKAEAPNEAFFRWKHLDNPFGASPMWLAEVDGVLAGFRTFLRWELVRPDGSVARAVRAVDTATHPDFQGRGIFTALTQQAVDELTAEGDDFVFNTPNDKSRPGYLKMGWVELGRPPVQMRVGSAGSSLRIVRARSAAEKWSEPTLAGDPVRHVVDDAAKELAALLSGPDDRYRTHRTPAYLRWRYRFADLRYRVMPLSRSLQDGFCVFRLRQRGAAVEATVCELFVPDDDSAAMRELAGRVLVASRADYLMWAGRRLPGAFVPLPRQGPIVTWRALSQTEVPPLPDWDLTMGDLELF